MSRTRNKDIEHGLLMRDKIKEHPLPCRYTWVSDRGVIKTSDINHDRGSPAKELIERSAILSLAIAPGKKYVTLMCVPTEVTTESFFETELIVIGGWATGISISIRNLLMRATVIKAAALVLSRERIAKLLHMVSGWSLKRATLLMPGGNMSVIALSSIGSAWVCGTAGFPIRSDDMAATGMSTKDTTKMHRVPESPIFGVYKLPISHNGVPVITREDPRIYQEDILIKASEITGLTAEYVQTFMLQTMKVVSVRGKDPVDGHTKIVHVNVQDKSFPLLYEFGKTIEARGGFATDISDDSSSRVTVFVPPSHKAANEDIDSLGMLAVMGRLFRKFKEDMDQLPEDIEE